MIQITEYDKINGIFFHLDLPYFIFPVSIKLHGEVLFKVHID